MNAAIEALLERAEQRGWTVRRGAAPLKVPSHVATRYGELPGDLRELLQTVELFVAPDEKAWFLCVPDFSGTSGAAFTWDELERMSLEAAGRDPKLRGAVASFWDAHLPVYLSVRSGYEYCAVAMADGSVVHGLEPDFEDATRAHEGFLELLHAIVDDGGVAR